MWKSMEKGFTLIELMVVVLITVVGFMAIVVLQAATVKGVTNSRDLVAAVNLAEHFLNSVRIEALEWTNDTDQGTNQAKFKYLNNVGLPVAGNGSGWLQAYINAMDVDKRINQNGNDTTFDAGLITEFPQDRNKRFCLQYRLTWVIPNRLIRAEARVLWPREEADVAAYQECPLGMEADVSNVYGITVPTTIMKNIFVTY